MAQGSSLLPLAVGAIVVAAVAGTSKKTKTSTGPRTPKVGETGDDECPPGWIDMGDGECLLMEDEEGDAPPMEDDIPSITPDIENWITEGREHLDPDKAYPGERNMQLVNSLVMHGMGFSRGSDPIKYMGVTAHFIIMPNGRIAQLQPFERNLKASNSFNKYSISVEFAGNFPSTRGKCYKPERFGCDEVTPEQIAAGRYLIDHLIAELPNYGSPGLQGVYAHRQSSSSRGNDPGPDIWYYVGEWALRNRGLSSGGPGYKVGSGKALPDSWVTWGDGGYAGRERARLQTSLRSVDAIRFPHVIV